MTLDEIRAYLLAEFEQVFGDSNGMTLDRAADGESTVRVTPGWKHLRPGGILSGPTLMAAADAGAYAALLSLGGHAKMAVTTNLSINFLKAAPADTDLLTHTRIIKNGRRLAVLECQSIPEGAEDIVAHTVMTYAFPVR